MTPCPSCGWVHGGDEVVAVGRFDPAAPTRYRAVNVPDAPLRETRAEAMRDVCDTRRAAS